MYSTCLKETNSISSSRPNWESAKKLMVDTNFLKRLMTYDKEHMSEVILKKVRKYTTDKEFDPNVSEPFCPLKFNVVI